MMDLGEAPVMCLSPAMSKPSTPDTAVTCLTLATKEAKSSGQFAVPGLGKAVKANRKACMGRNPQTGEAIKIPAKTVVKFRLAKAFKEAVVPPKKKSVPSRPPFLKGRKA